MSVTNDTKPYTWDISGGASVEDKKKKRIRLGSTTHI